MGNRRDPRIIETCPYISLLEPIQARGAVRPKKRLFKGRDAQLTIHTLEPQEAPKLMLIYSGK